MKRKFTSVIAAMFIFVACLFAGACGDKYRGMEFQVLYAFSADAENWFDGTNGISLNYNPNEEEVEGDEKSSLIFNDFGEATVYLKVVVNNVKSKYVDLISIASPAVSGLSLSSTQVEQNQVFAMNITGNVDTTLKLYENNSGNRHESSIVVSRTLEGMVADTNVKPGITTNGTLDLYALNNLTYLPEDETNQIGANYSIASIGYYNASGLYVATILEENAKNYVKVENGRLKVIDGKFFNASSYVIKMRATSTFHPGDVEEGIDPIECYFDVFVVENSVAIPEVMFYNFKDSSVGETIGGQINLYENGIIYNADGSEIVADYSKSYLYVDSTLLDSQYAGDGLNTEKDKYGTINKLAYSTVVYVENAEGVYEKYDFEDAKYQAGINGLIVKPETNGIFALSISNRTTKQNKIKIAYEIQGLDFSVSQKVIAEKEYIVMKDVMPSYITVNDSVDLNEKSGEQVATIYGTASQTYKGLQLKLTANPNDNTARVIELKNNNGGLIITDSKGNVINGKITTGTTIFVKFKNDVVEVQDLIVKTLKAPIFFNEKNIEAEIVNNDLNYLTVKYQINKVVTADKFEFVKNENNIAEEISSKFIDASKKDYAYVKAYFTGVYLDTTTITLKSDNAKVLFENGLTEISLSATESCGYGTDENGRYSIYKIAFKETNSAVSANINISTDDSVGVQSDLIVTSVHLMNEEMADSLDVDAKTATVREFGDEEQNILDKDFKFALSQGQLAELFVAYNQNETKAIQSIALTVDDVDGADFSMKAVEVEVISNSLFTAIGASGGKTQVMTLSVRYFKFDEEKQEIVAGEEVLSVQIAVFKAVSSINAVSTQNQIGFINEFYKETRATNISFSSYSSYGTPADQVVFTGEESYSGASQVRVNINQFERLKNSGAVSIKYVHEGIVIDLLQENGTTLYYDATDDAKENGKYLIDGVIEVELINTVNDLDSIQLTLKNYMFDNESNIIANIVINIATVDIADKILISGDALNVTADDSTELKLSFKNVLDGGYDEKSFNATLKFNGDQRDGEIRYEDIETALTHLLYQYKLDASGSPVGEPTLISNNFLTVTYGEGTVSVRARKELGGGLFKLVLATKDSFDPTKTELVEGNFSTRCSITVRIEDGILAAYSIETVEDLKTINYNLNKNFVLAANLDISSLDFKPLGLIDGVPNSFKGMLTGDYSTTLGDGSEKVTSYSIKLTVKESAESSEYGNLFGLFAVLDEKAVVQNLNLDVKFARSFGGSLSDVKVGALTGVNNGTIKNVKVNILNDAGEIVDFSTASGIVDFGGMVGVNYGIVENSTVVNSGKLNIKSSATTVHNIGLLAGTNTNTDESVGTITGSYNGKNSLNNFVYDIYANISVENTATMGTAVYNVGSAVGTNNGAISGLLAGGNIVVSTVSPDAGTVQKGSIGGLVGKTLNLANQEANNNISLSTVMALNINIIGNNNVVFSNMVNVGGVVGDADKTEINNVKFVSVFVENNGIETYGQIYGTGLVAGVAGTLTNGTLKNSSVESFIETVIDKTQEGEPEITFNSVIGTSIVGGLSAGISGSIVENSFVNANISGGQIYLTTNANEDNESSEENTYFIGRVEGNVDKNNTTYNFVNGKLNNNNIDLNSYLTILTDETVQTISNWSNIYERNDLGGGQYQYISADKYTAGKTYVQFNLLAWSTFVQSLVTWEAYENYNVVRVNNIKLFLPFLTYNNDALMIVKPESINANIDQTYVASNKSSYIKEFNYLDYNITESVVVNFFDKAGDEANTHTFFEHKDKNGQTVNGLLDINLLPNNPYEAQGGFAYEMIGDGYKFAYINESKQIVFTSASGNIPIIVKIYSVFDPTKYVYVAFFSQSLLTDLKLSANSLYNVEGKDYDYEINTYTGDGNKLISMIADNYHMGVNNLSVLDVHNLSQYLKVQINEIEKADGSKISSHDNYKDSLLNISSASHNNITLKIELEEGEKVSPEYTELITFSLLLDSQYFGSVVEEDVVIGSVKVLVRMYNAATSIEVLGEDVEITTSDDINFNVNLATDYFDEANVNNAKTKNVDGDFVVEVQEDDGIKISLIVDENSETEKQKLIDNVNLTLPQEKQISNFSELFAIDVKTSLFVSKGKTIGYSYNVSLELIDNHYYRYIKNNIIFNIIVSATNNSKVSNAEMGGIEILMKPTLLSTATIENYAVKTLNVNHDYSTLVTNNDIETSIIEPGNLGNVMMIYLEPTYSNVKKATVKTSELYVPSLGKNVMMKFTQLVVDKRNGKNAFSTLYGGENHVQEGDTLELELISRINADGRRVYDGVICVYIQLEKFGGLEGTLTAELNVETGNGKVVTRSRDLLTTYLPEVRMEYSGEAISNGYLIQKGTSNNEIKIKIFGYQFNSNPKIELNWLETSNFTFVGGNKQIITDGEKTYHIGDYVSRYLINDITDVVYNSYEDSYTISLKIRVDENIPSAFSVGADLQLTTKDGQLASSFAHENTINFYPANYLLNTTAEITGLANGRKNIVINKTGQIGFNFSTDNSVYDMNEEIYLNLLEYVYSYQTDINASVEERKTELMAYVSTLSNEQKHEAEMKLARRFTYYKNGSFDFSQTELHPEFEFGLISGDTISITGLAQFNNLINFNIGFGYKLDTSTGLVQCFFGEVGSQNITTTLSASFTLNIYIVDEEHEILIYSPDDIYDSNGTWHLEEGGHYVLMNDIELEQVVPITTAIGSFDGNNRVISIKSFMVDATTSSYGLFASIGSYTVQDQETETNITKQTLLKNMIVDYGNFDGTIALNNQENSNITFGGLVGVNNGGLIYNCDVMNLNYGTDKNINIVVGSSADVTFGGLVGENSGIITNSRVGRKSYTKMIATETTKSVTEKNAGGLTFKVFNKESGYDAENQFAIVAGGFVGSNTGTISSSYVERTNLINYSTNETSNITAGFVGVNSGSITYSYAKADENTQTTSNPYATGYVIENKRNGIVAGFVYNNIGTISNAYANLELKTESTYIAGFVYNNTGTITESYAATTMNATLQGSNAEQPFVGVDNAGNLLSTGTLENTYYLMRSAIDNPYTQGDLDVAQGLNLNNFQNSENLFGFSFVLSTSKTERQQGTWSYYSVDNKKRSLPELVTAGVVAHSHKFIISEENGQIVFGTVKEYEKGTFNNPHTISNVEEFNNVFTENNQSPSGISGHVRLINNINFNDDKTAIKTRTNYVLGSSTSITSIEGNGMSIGGIYLDVGEATVEKIGLFAEIKNAYIKNLNLNFATPTTDGQFSTTTATYSGGLAGTISNSVIINLTLNGENTTLTGKNFVGGVAGLISGNSLLSGVETNLNVKASSTENYLYYNQKDYNDLNIRLTSYYVNHADYVKHLSYAGGIAGVLDLAERTGAEYNLQFVNIRGDLMEGKTEANIMAEYAGGVAGYANENTKAYKLNYVMGEAESIRGNTAVGGLFGVNLGSITASQVSAKEDIQYANDTKIGEYIIDLQSGKTTELKTNEIGNTKLLQSRKYAGGLVGVGLNSKIKASYSKASINSGVDVGGLIGVSVGSIVNYSYAIPFINISAEMKNVGGLFGSVYSVETTSPTRNNAIKDYEKLLVHKGIRSQYTDAQFTYSTLIVENNKLDTVSEDLILDYLVANYRDEDKTYIRSNDNSNLVSVYVGAVKYLANGDEDPIVLNQTKETSNSTIVDLFKLYNVGDPEQTIAFQEVFSGWSIVKLWSLKEEKYFPLLKNEPADNFIDIDDAIDLEQVRNNLDGKFRIIKPIVINEVEANWVIPGLFEGVFIGEIEGDNTRPTITIQGITPNSNNTTGFFQFTKNATISNLSFVWETEQTNGTAFDLRNKSVTMVSGVTCEDENSLISNVEVIASAKSGDTDGYMLNRNAQGNEDKTISGFGAIVGKATNTNLLDCSFAGKVSATLLGDSNIFVGGLVGEANTSGGSPSNGENDSNENKENSSLKASVINNSKVGVRSRTIDLTTYPTTSFDLTIAEDNNANIYVGGVVGKSFTTSVASSTVGGSGYDDAYKHINFNLNLNDLKNNIYVGGVVGYATNGTITSCQAWSNITLFGNVATNSQNIQVGGLAGAYDLEGSTLTSGVAKCNALTSIQTYKQEGYIVTPLLTATSTSVRLSAGVAELGTSASMSQCYFEGLIDTEKSQINTLYAGGAVGIASSTANASSITEVISNVELLVGSSATNTLYAGGLIGQANNVNVSYSTAWGRVVPITATTAQNIYAGGLIAYVNGTGRINNSYTLVNIIADSIAGTALKNLQIGALIGVFKGNTVNYNITNVFYSSDLALFANNYDIGSNVDAQTLLRSNSWQTQLKAENGVSNTIWKTLKVGTVSRVPYLTSLEEILFEYKIIGKQSAGATTNDYVLGSQRNPQEISKAKPQSFNEDNYTYYMLLQTEDAGTLPTFSGMLNGFLIAEDLDIDKTFRVAELSYIEANNKNNLDNDYYGTIPAIAKHSAVSNLHVVVESDVSELGVFGIISGCNNGVIFNSSVQGSGISLNSGAYAGLISAVNNGLIANCFSTAEILSTSCEIGGIVHTNNGKLLSNYFTGYVNTTNRVAGLSVSNAGDNYSYNNYMAGVIKGLYSNNFAFYSIANGSNNYIDKFVDLAYNETYQGLNKDNAVLHSVSTAELMAGALQTEEGGLTGSWHFAVNCDQDGEEYSFDTTKPMFGRNYNYPIYKFNKVTSNDGITLTENNDEYKHQLYTGTGLVNPDVYGESITFENIYSELVSPFKYELNVDEYDDYYHAFKIPHLGVLTAVNNLSSKYEYALDDGTIISLVRAFVVVYDINGEYNGNNLKWTSVGGSSIIEGFKGSNGFNGVFISNKGYNFSTGENSYCSIAHLQGNGLFADINSAYFGSIGFGSFNALKQSGVLGINTVKGSSVIVNNIHFVEGTVIEGSNAITTDEFNNIVPNYFGALFGLVEGNVSVKTIKTSTRIGENENPNVKITSLNAVAGFVAGQLGTNQNDGKITIEEGSNIYVKFSGNTYAGGVVGRLKKGTISGGIISVASNNNEASVETLGGVAGIANGGTITNITINLYNPKTESLGAIFSTNNFGGICGEVNGAVTTSANLTSNQDNLILNGSAQSSDEVTRYYGLAAGYVHGTDNYTVDITIERIKTIQVKNSASFNSSSTISGVGLIVGSFTSSGNLNATLNSKGTQQGNGENQFVISIESVGIPNLGGIIGYTTNGSVLNNIKTPQSRISIEGTTNVGGFVGYLNLKQNLTGVNNDLYNVSPIINIGVGSNFKDLNNNFENIGGLFGQWDGGYTGAEIISRTEINVNVGKQVNNVGGVVGKLTTGGVANLTYNGTFVTGEVMTVDENKIENNDGAEICKLMNVGGIAGLVSANTTTDENGKIELLTATLTDLLYSGESIKVFGYQNVGGLVGYLNENVTISNSSALPLVGDTLLNDNGKIEDDDASNMVMEKITQGNVYGVINVGGAVGYAHQNSTIQQVLTKTNVYGNSNVGGVVGLSNSATIKNNYLTNGVVKGIYYRYSYIVQQNNGNVTHNKDFIPTGVGGIAGASIKSSITHNMIEGVLVTSANETIDGSYEVIKITSNYMSTMKIGVGNNFEEFASIDTIVAYDSKYSALQFDEISTGYGGFIGAVDTESLKSADTNHMIDVDVNAQLGVNTGTYYGVYNASENMAINLPRFTANQEIYIDGAYNIGGLIGFVNAASAEIGETTFGSLNNTLIAGGAEIHVQSRHTGMYVGGLVGKTNSDRISGLKLAKGIESVNVFIHTNNNFYIGGLIGRAEVGHTSSSAEISGQFGLIEQVKGVDTPDDDSDDEYDCVSDEELIVGDNTFNFGGFIGMLKVMSREGGVKTKVSGLHDMPFTINTVENSNYLDGDSRFKTNTKTGLVLEAEAYYVNLDSFDIVGSNDRTLYTVVKDENGKIIDPKCNPLNPSAKGWSKQYTAFKQLQRNIPLEENNGAQWDSIQVLFDASQITHVGTIGNLNLNKNELTWPSGTNVDNITDDHICFTVYEQAEGKETLYSSIGIATIHYEYADDGTEKYAKPKNLKPNLRDWILAVFNEEAPPSMYYLDLSYYGNKTKAQGLTYFNWCDEYYAIGTSEEFSYQNQANSVRHLTYFVKDYYDAVIKDGENEIKGAYFVFDVVYENESVSGKTYNTENNIFKEIFGTAANGNTGTRTDDYLSPDGSIFNAIGTMSVTVAAYQNNENATDWFQYNVKVAVLTAEIVLFAFTAGQSTLAKTATKRAFKGMIKAAGKAIAKTVKKHFFKIIFGIMVSSLLIQLVDSTNAYSNFASPTDLHYGFLTTTYSKDIIYSNRENGIVMVGGSDLKYVNDDGEIYSYYSSTRPNDYHINKYVGIKLTNVDADVKGSNAEYDQDNGKWIEISKSLCSEWHEKVELTVNEETQEYTVAGIGNDYYLVSDKYEYTDGQYYIFGMYGELDFYRAVTKFSPEKATETDHIDANGAYFVHGSFDHNSGYEYRNNYPGNNLLYNNGSKTYSINNKTIEKIKAENSSKKFKYVYDDRLTVEDYQNDTTKIYGYDWFDRAYYVTAQAGGVAELGAKYATYAYLRDVDGNTSDLGKLGVDYIIEKYYKETEETITNDDGSQIVNKFGKPTDAYFVLSDEAFTDNTTLPELNRGNEKQGVTLTSTSKMNVAVHPGSFKNPYINKTNLKNSTSTFFGKPFVWDGSATSALIVWNPTYFAYDGGYIATNLDDEYPSIFLPLDESLYENGGGVTIKKITNFDSAQTSDKYTFDSTFGEQLVSYQDLINNWKEDSKLYNNGYYYLVYEEALLHEVYQVKGGKIYRADNSHTIKDGLLHKMYVINGGKDVDMNEGLYLANSSVGLYTRYRYKQGNQITDFSSSPWGTSYSLVPKDGSTIINGRTTRLAESARVVLSGNKPLRLTDNSVNNFGAKQPGVIVIR